MSEASGYAAGLLVSCALHAALFAGACALAALSDATPPDDDATTEAVTLDLSQVDLSFSDDEAEQLPVQAAPSAEALPTPPPPAARLPEPPPLTVPEAETAVPTLKPDDVSPLQPPELDAPETERPPEPPKEAQPAPSSSSPEAVAPAPVQARVDAPPKAQRIFKPKYPDEARRRGEQGDVTLELTVDARGRVETVRVVASCGFPALEKAAEAAARRATFKPAKRDGTPVSGVARLTLTFRLND